MIISELCGGLGNQMFQYAAGKALAMKHNVPHTLDLTKYSTFNSQSKDTKRYFGLDNFSISAGQSSIDQVASLKSFRETCIEKLFTFIFNKHHPLYSGFFKEPHFQYTSTFKKLSGNVYLAGFWQSEKYFVDIASTIREEFSLKEEWQANLLSLYAKIVSCNSVSIHVRRGDYVCNAEINNYHGTCNEMYYKNAIKYIVKRIPNVVFFMFSDEPHWMKENIDVSRNEMVWVNEEGRNRACDDMVLMSCCKHHIIANSSFSWWGAWLNVRSEKTVICPRQWFAGVAHNTTDLLPQNWIQM